MMDIILNTLTSVQDKHVDYFFENHRTIADYVEIDWDRPFNYTYRSGQTLPPDIAADVEQSFDRLLIF